MRTLIPLLLLVMGSACGGSVDARDYGQTCSVNTDCVAVYSGQLCQVCGGCANAAISTSSHARYAADVSAIANTCPPRLGPQPLCAPCMEMAAACDAGVCVLAAR